MYDPGELAREARHATSDPVGAEALGDLGQQIDNAWVIATDHCHHERRRHSFSPLVRIISK
jgi:hypothetical protein